MKNRIAASLFTAFVPMMFLAIELKNWVLHDIDIDELQESAIICLSIAVGLGLAVYFFAPQKYVEMLFRKKRD